MQHLNIPLSRNSRTTRRSRWVVWLLVFTVMSSAVATYWISTLWFTRDTIYAAAPENTIMAVRFFTSGEKGKFVESVLQNVPLISNRALTFRDIAPYASGEIVLFLNKNGSRSVAIRTNKTPLPQKLLDAHSIAVQPVYRSIVLVSEHQETLKPLILKPKLFPALSFPGHRWIGELIDSSFSQRSFIHASQTRVDISVTGERINSNAFKQIPEDTIAYLSNPLLTNTSTEYLNPFLPLMQYVIDPLLLEYLGNLSREPNQVILTKNTKEEIGFFLTTLSKKDKMTPNIEQALRSISALNSPKIQQTVLSDGSFIKEIIANPDAVSIEQITLLGTPVSRIRVHGADLLAGTTHDQGVFLTNKEELLRTHKTGRGSKNKICLGNVAGITIQPLVDRQNQHGNSPNTNSILLFAQNFKSVGVKSGWFSTTIHLCK